MGHKILHRKQKKKQWATKYYTENKKYKQWATKYYTENKNINNGPQNTTQKTKKKTMGHKILHRKQKI
jgi:hypothetical protein